MHMQLMLERSRYYTLVKILSKRIGKIEGKLGTLIAN